MKSIKLLINFALMVVVGIGVAITRPDSAFATGNKGGWAIITAQSIRWVEYPGSDGALLYDRETGLIWEQTASTSNVSDWISGASRCFNRGYEIGGKTVKGFRLPTVAELTNLGESTSVFDGVSHSVDDGTSGFFVAYRYLSSELVNANGASYAWAVRFLETIGVGTFNFQAIAGLVPTEGPDGSADHYRVLCVRGPGGSASGNANF
ncbi:MAG TPA: hypothetical protein VJR29_09915 [bacterium]|nr:hypothetical protein [bacterium]